MPLPTRKYVASLASRHEQLDRSCRLFLCPRNPLRYPASLPLSAGLPMNPGFGLK